MRRPKLRDSNRLMDSCYGIGDIPIDIIVKIGGSIVFIIYTAERISLEKTGATYSQRLLTANILIALLGSRMLSKGKQHGQ